MIETTIMDGTQYAVFEPNDMKLWEGLKRTINSFLRGLWRDGALFGATAEQAFYVKCDAETNPPESIDQGKVVVEVGIAPVKPAEFVIFRIAQIKESRPEAGEREEGLTHASNNTRPRPRTSSSIGSWFSVELDNGIAGDFTDASGLGYRGRGRREDRVDHDGRHAHPQAPGHDEVRDITLKRTSVAGQEVLELGQEDPRRQARVPHQRSARHVRHGRQPKLGRWTFNNAWPSKWSASDLDVGSDDLMTEEVTLAVEELIRNK